MKSVDCLRSKIGFVDRRTEFNDLVPSYILADTIQDLFGSGLE